MKLFNQDQHTPVLPSILAIAIVLVILLNIYSLIAGI